MVNKGLTSSFTQRIIVCAIAGDAFIFKINVSPFILKRKRKEERVKKERKKVEGKGGRKWRVWWVLGLFNNAPDRKNSRVSLGRRERIQGFPQRLH